MEENIAINTLKQSYKYVFFDKETGEVKASNNKSLLRTINKLNKEGWNYKQT